jgi:glycosyltransferase involved in cell wall biosynthesis
MGLIDDATLNYVYNAADVFLLLSRGGSFEIPLAESQAAGTPVITTNFSAMKENCLTGWTVNGLYHAFTPMTRQMVVDPLQAAQWLEQAYGIWERGEMPLLRKRTRDAAVDRYDIRTVMQQYALPAFQKIAQDLEKEPQNEWLRRRQKAARNLPKKKVGMRP